MLLRAELRQARREQALQRLAQMRPEPPKGLLATFQSKGHQQALAAWERTKALAGKLAQEAKELAQRLRGIARPERVKQWAQAFVDLRTPQPIARRDLTGPAQLDQVMPRPAAAQPSRQTFDPRAEFERAWSRVNPLLQKEKDEALSLAEKQQFARGWDALATLIDEGHRQANPEQRKGIDVARLQAHRRVAADMFLNLPRVEALEQNPRLAGAYGLLDVVDQHAEAQGMNGQVRAQEIGQVKRRIAAAIENGEELQVTSGRLEVVSPRVASQRPVQRDPGKDRGREPER